MANKFDGFVSSLSSLPPDIKDSTLDQLEQMCICSECPSYTKCAGDRNELLYCIKGRSGECIKKKAGCLCGRCAVTEEIGLTMIYFCLEGTEEEQRGSM